MTKNNDKDNQKKNQNNILQEICKVAGSAFDTAVNVKNDLVQIIKDNVDNTIKGMNFVKKEEFDMLKKKMIDLEEKINNLTGNKKSCQNSDNEGEWLGNIDKINESQEESLASDFVNIKDDQSKKEN